MCGIVGVVALGDTAVVERGDLNRMADRLVHRGPDSSGIWQEDNARVGLAHRRLAILDLTHTGHQPMLSASGRFVVVYNGETYNHRQLRAALGTRVWRGASDTETLLACFDAWGLPTTLDRIVGMFALAVWDRREGRLTLARDRFGEKPLYYSWVGDGLTRSIVFASELKALRAHPKHESGIDRRALGTYFELSYIPAPYTIHPGTYKLEPGTYLAVETATGTVTKKRYFAVEERFADAQQHACNASEIETVDRLEAVLAEAVEGQMLADVPVGAFLSGGIDSSLIVALMQAQSMQRVRTFTIGYREDAYSEAQHARAVAAALNTEHTELFVNDEMARSAIERLPSIYDEPFADPSQLPTFLVSQLARQSVTVSLSGDGGDELFGGYNRYVFANRYWNSIRALPRNMRVLIGRAVTARPEEWWDRVGAFLPLTSVGFKFHKAARVIRSADTAELYREMVSHWKREDRIVRNGAAYETCATTLPPTPKGGPVEWMMLRDSLTYLPDDILVKLDRAAMSVSLEGRTPFLDHRVASFAWQLPWKDKLRRGETKWILRQLLYRYVPRDLVERPKMGFGFPIAMWLRGNLRDWAESLLAIERLNSDGLLNAGLIRERWKQHLSGKHNWAIQLWSVLMFQAWRSSARVS